MSEVDEVSNANTGREEHGQSASVHRIPPLSPVIPAVRELWESYRNVIETKAQKYFSMPGTFQMIPLKMSILDIEGVKTYFFKARLPNNKFVNVRLRLSGEAESRDNQIAVESRASGDLDEEITKIF